MEPERGFQFVSILLQKLLNALLQKQYQPLSIGTNPHLFIIRHFFILTNIRENGIFL